MGLVLQVIGEAAGGGDLHREQTARPMGRQNRRCRGRGGDYLDVKGHLLGPHFGSRVISSHLAVDGIKVSRRVGLDRQVEGPEVWAGARWPRHEEVRGGSGEVAGPGGVRRAVHVVAAVVDAPGAEVVDVQPVIAAVAIGHAELDNGGLAGADLEHLVQACPEVGSGLKVDDDHPILRHRVALLAVDEKSGAGAAAQREHRAKCDRDNESVPHGPAPE